MALALDEDRLEAPLEYMSDTTRVPIEALRVHTVELSHPARQVCRGRLDDQVIVVAHQAVGMAPPSEPVDDVRERLQECPPVLVVEKDRFSRIATRSDVVERSSELDPQWPSHASILGRRPVRIGPATTCRLQGSGRRGKARPDPARAARADMDLVECPKRREHAE
jgi:hypothetical protein